MNRKFFFHLFIVALLACCMCACSYTAINLNQDIPIVKRADLEYPKAIVVYDSWSGNTEFIAKAISEKLMCPAVQVDHANEYDMTVFDLIVIGSPVHGGMPTGKIDDFLSELPKPRMSAVFVTFGAPGFGPLTADSCLDNMEEKLSGTCLGRFKCHGFHKILRTYSSHPDEKDRADADHFAGCLLEWCMTGEDTEVDNIEQVEQVEEVEQVEQVAP